MVINKNDLDKVQADFGEIFSEVKLGLSNVSSLYGNLNGHYHAPYWATDWLYIQGKKD